MLGVKSGLTPYVPEYRSVGVDMPLTWLTVVVLLATIHSESSYPGLISGILPRVLYASVN
jgi:hypothetical protein